MKKAVLHIVSILVLTVGIGACAEKLSTNADRNQLRVMTYNIHHANPPSKSETGEIDLEAIADVIRKESPDLVALQEVDVNTRRSGGVNQAEALAKLLDMHAFFGRAIDHDGGQYGVAILSRYPLSNTSVIQLPEDADPKAEDRVLTTAHVKLPGGMEIRFGSTHLDVRSPENRDQQVLAINEIAQQGKVPFIVAGDFNAVPESSAIKELDKVFTRTCLSDCDPTIPVDKPSRTIDFIAFTKMSPFNVVSQRVIPERYASDHLPVVAVLSF